jgi:poly(3-hydroxybutyrate) depolymerase
MLEPTMLISSMLLATLLASSAAAHGAAQSPVQEHAPVQASILDELRVALQPSLVAEGALLDRVARLPGAQTPLGRGDAATTVDLVWNAYAASVRESVRLPSTGGTVEVPGAGMRYTRRVFGEKPEKGWSLVLSLHGGGAAAPSVNDQQWENQQRLYTLDEGIYVVPRAPGNTWDLWHRPEIDKLFDRLIRDFLAVEGVDPDRVYVIGYSAGGDGVYQLAPRMADRFAGAAMMAGHPNETKPDGLRNIAFALHMGANDHAFERNRVAERWRTLLEELRAADPDGYPHQVVIHPGKSHWMDREDAAAIPWIKGFTRDPRPKRIVWLQDDVVHDRFYWLAVDEPKAGDRLVVERSGNTITIAAASRPLRLRIRLDDTMVDLDQEIVVRTAERELLRTKATRTLATIVRTLDERGDPRSIFTAEIAVDVPVVPETPAAKDARPASP